MKTALTIAGSDSGGGAGIQADLKTFSALGVFGMSVITAVTAQNTMGVFGVEDISPALIAKQMDAVFSDLPVDAVKIGMLSNAEAIRTIADRLRQYQPRNIVLDPVMISKTGYRLLQPDATAALIEQLLPLADVITPNLHEAGALLNREIRDIEEMERAAEALRRLGAKAVLVKGGHLDGEPVDILYDGETFTRFSGRRVQTNNTHGTGCTLSSAIAAHLARGCDLKTAVGRAKTYIQGAIENALDLGAGAGPTHHFHPWYGSEGLEA